MPAKFYSLDYERYSMLIGLSIPVLQHNSELRGVRIEWLSTGAVYEMNLACKF
jgi:hypothetical protein